jgi:hypothetical protein
LVALFHLRDDVLEEFFTLALALARQHVALLQLGSRTTTVFERAQAVVEVVSQVVVGTSEAVADIVDISLSANMFGDL